MTDIMDTIKQNSTTLLLGGGLGVIWMLIFPKSTSIFGPKIGVPVGWGTALLLLGLGAYGFMLNGGLKSGYASSYYTMPITRPIPTIMPRQYRPVRAQIITGTQQNGPTNPAYDKNTPFSLIGDVY